MQPVHCYAHGLRDTCRSVLRFSCPHQQQCGSLLPPPLRMSCPSCLAYLAFQFPRSSMTATFCFSQAMMASLLLAFPCCCHRCFNCCLLNTSRNLASTLESGACVH